MPSPVPVAGAKAKPVKLVEGINPMEIACRCAPRNDKVTE
jgi:hypothetical protein